MATWKKVITAADTASATAQGIVELATTAETTAGTDTTRAVTPDGLKDGYQGSANVTTLGTITTGTWNGSVIAEAYLQNQSGTNTGDEPDASTTVKGVVELATTAETTTGTDATRAVTPDGLKDGYQGSTNVTTLGTISAGTWNGTAIGVAYGGTGLSSVAKGSLIHTTADDTFAALSGGTGDNGKVVSYNETNDIFELVDAGTATNANNVAVTVASDNEAKYITFVDGTTGNQALEVNTALQYNPSTGTVTVNGNLDINGATNTIDVQTLTVEDATILLSDGSSTAAGADGSGLVVSSTSTAANRADFVWKDTNLGVAGWQFKDDGAPASFPAMGVAALTKGAADPTSTIMPTGALWYNDGTAGTKGLYLYID